MNKYITNIAVPGVNENLKGIDGSPKYEKFQTIPQYHPPLNLYYQIPKIIHFVWIGSPLPYKYVKNIETFVATNVPKYIIKLWVDYDTPSIPNVVIEDVRKLRFTFINQDIYDSETNWGSKADILRYEIIYNEGGICSDIDAISIKPYDENFEKAFVAYTGAPYNDICNGFFGLPAGSYFLKYVIECLREVRTYTYDFNSLPTKIRIPLLTGPTLFTYCFKYYNDSNIQMINQDIIVIHRNNPDAYSYHTFDSVWWNQ